MVSAEITDCERGGRREREVGAKGKQERRGEGLKEMVCLCRAPIGPERGTQQGNHYTRASDSSLSHYTTGSYHHHQPQPFPALE